jgi:hypothetical protein
MMETLAIVLIVLLSLVTLVASFIFIRGLFPQRVDKVRDAIEDQGKRVFWLGLVNTIFISIIAFGLGSIAENVPILYIPTFAIYGAFLIGLLYGLTAFTQILGDRLFPDIPPVKKDIRAGAVLLVSSLLPFVGWFLLFPYAIFLSIGGVVLALYQNRKPREKRQKKQEKKE